MSTITQLADKQRWVSNENFPTIKYMLLTLPRQFICQCGKNMKVPKLGVWGLHSSHLTLERVGGTKAVVPLMRLLVSRRSCSLRDLSGEGGTLCAPRVHKRIRATHLQDLCVG